MENRLTFTSWVIVLVGTIMVVRLFFVQVIHGPMYADKADHQYVAPEAHLLNRYSIFMTTKDGVRVSLATTVSGFMIVADPALVSNPENTFQQLASYLDLDHDTFIRRMKDSRVVHVEIGHQLSKDQADAIQALHIPGITLERDSWRNYPGKELASRLVGYVGYKDDTLIGRYGLERSYDKTLTNTEGGTLSFFADIFQSLNSFFNTSKENSGDIVTTIEPTVEGILERYLQNLQTTLSADGAYGIIMDPNDGSIYALAGIPNFDPNSYSKYPISTFQNPIVENVYELGSVVKSLTMAAGIDTGTVTPETTYDDKGFLVIDKKRIENFDGKGRGPHTTMQQVLDESLNTGVAYVEMKMGNELFRNYMYKFGVKEKTGVDLPGEVHSLVSNLQSTRDIEYVTSAFGQGIALTPIAAVRAFAAISNGGYLVTPHVAKSIVLPSGVEEDFSFPKGTEPIIKPETSTTITAMLTKVVDEGLLAGSLKNARYTIAAKTGTAQVAKEGGGGYDPNKLVHAMFGYYPATHPKFLTFIMVVNPHGQQFAANSLARPFVSLANELISYYNIEPDR